MVSWSWTKGARLYNGEENTATVYSHTMKVKVAQLCLTLCNPVDYTVQGILQDKILEQVAFPFSKGSSQPWD